MKYPENRKKAPRIVHMSEFLEMKSGDTTEKENQRTCHQHNEPNNKSEESEGSE